MMTAERQQSREQQGKLMKSSTYPVVFKVTCHFHLSKATSFKMTQGKGMVTINTTMCTGKKQEKERGKRILLKLSFSD